MTTGARIFVAVLATASSVPPASVPVLAQAPEDFRIGRDASAAFAASGPPTGGASAVWAPSQDASQAPEDDRWSFAGTAKWGTLAISAGTAAYGFSLNSQADDIFARLEGACLEDPERCEGRNPDGSFTDEELEGLYQDTLSRDRQARAALLVSQLALAASVVFFIVDLTDRSPPNVPYDPPVTVEVGPRPDGAFVLGARLRVGRLGH